ncbi:MAG: hypothetical protein JSV70_09830, partial [bacterium]
MKKQSCTPASCSSHPSRGSWQEDIQDLVLSFLNRAGIFREAAAASGTPLYLFEPDVMEKRARAFTGAFRSHIADFEAFFAMKCNNHPDVAATAVQAGLGLDVSSGMELQRALDAGCERILFSGPGKTKGELELAAANAGKVTVLLDSFGELERLEEAASGAGTAVGAGVRLTTVEQGLWR